MARARRRSLRTPSLPPLRRIIGERRNEYGVVLELLECGHEQRQKHDIIGPTNAYRRRCRRCHGC